MIRTALVVTSAQRAAAGSSASSQLAVEAIRVEPSRGRLSRSQVDDVEYLAGGTAEGDAVAVIRNDVGLPVYGDALVQAGVPVEAVAGAGDRVGIVGAAALVQHGPDCCRVVSLHGQDAGGGVQVGLIVDQRRCPLEGGDPDVLEEE